MTKPQNERKVKHHIRQERNDPNPHWGLHVLPSEKTGRQNFHSHVPEQSRCISLERETGHRNIHCCHGAAKKDCRDQRLCQHDQRCGRGKPKDRDPTQTPI